MGGNVADVANALANLRKGGNSSHLGSSSNLTIVYPVVPPEDQNVPTVLEVPHSDPYKLMVWGIACGAISLFIFFIATMQYVRKVVNSPKTKRKMKKRKDNKRKAKEEKLIQELTVEPIPAADFSKELRRRKKKRIINLEFKVKDLAPFDIDPVGATLQDVDNALGRRQTDQPCEIALLQDNRKKNSNDAILPFDHSRVMLQGTTEDAPHVDYINASYVDSHSRQKTYIAAQGPNRHTIADFWKMIWQEKSYCIVMATNVFEHARQQCEKYWHNQHGRYGDIDVWLATTDILADFNVRTFRVKKEGGAEERIIRQFQFASWSDHDCPSPSAVLEYRRRVRAFLSQKPGPMVVHCSAGAGRTGAFIAIDAALERVSVEKSVDIFNYVLYLRNTRQNMVRTLQQYEFIYETIDMFLQCGVTVIKAKELPYVVQQLAVKNPQTKLNGFDREFKSLQTVVPKLTVGECAGGHRAENRRKSRDVMVQPPERARPYLITHDSNDSTDYINAVYVDGYRHTNAYIVTQWPVRSTVNDIWRLIYDYNIPTLVLLNDIPISKNFPCFWPTELNEEVQYGPLTVECIEDREDQGISTMLFRIRKTSILSLLHKQPRKYEELMEDFLKYLEKKCQTAITLDTLVSLQQMASGGEDTAKTVRMFRLRTWPNKDRVPGTCSPLIDLLTRVEDWQLNECRGRIPTCVMSKNGVARCGIYCSISIAWDKLKAEGEVDIFRAVKTVKENRPHLVENMVEYIFCYSFMVILLDMLNKTQPSLIPVNEIAQEEIWEQRMTPNPAPSSTAGDSPFRVPVMVEDCRPSPSLVARGGDESEVESCNSFHTASDVILPHPSVAVVGPKMDYHNSRRLSPLERFRFKRKPPDSAVQASPDLSHKLAKTRLRLASDEGSSCPSSELASLRSQSPASETIGLAPYATCDDVGDVYFPALPDVPPATTGPGPGDTAQADPEIVLSALSLVNSEKHSLHSANNHSPNVKKPLHVNLIPNNNPVIVVNGYDSQSCSSTQDSNSLKSQESVIQVTIEDRPRQLEAGVNGTGSKADLRNTEVANRGVNVAQIECSEGSGVPRNVHLASNSHNNSPSKSPGKSPRRSPFKSLGSKSPSKKSKTVKAPEAQQEKFQFDNPAYSQSFQEISKNASTEGTRL